MLCTVSLYMYNTKSRRSPILCQKYAAAEVRQRRSAIGYILVNAPHYVELVFAYRYYPGSRTKQRFPSGPRKPRRAVLHEVVVLSPALRSVQK